MESPQQLLDKIHESGIFALDDKSLPTASDRADRAKQINPQLRQIREHAQQAIQQARQDNHRLPYALLDELTEELEIALRAFITDPNARIPQYGRVIFKKEGHWHIGTQSQAEDWALQRQAQALALKINAVEMALSDTRSKLKTAQRDLYRHDEAGRGVRLGVVGVLLVIAGVALYFVTQITPVLGLAGAGVLLLVVGVILFVRWRSRRHKLDDRFDTLQKRGREQFKQQQLLQERQAQIASRREQL
jgi:hypothetical protein